MLDNIIGMTMRSIRKSSLVTVQLNIHYLSSVSKGTIYAKANICKQSGRILAGEGEITDSEGNLLSKGSGTWKSMGIR
jgi:acyl-coenzyme A thioesterase PaaI-like protein